MKDMQTTNDLAHTLGDLAIEMENQHDTESVLRTITASAVVIIPGVRWAGISLIRGGAVEPRVPTDPVVTALDALQSTLDDGPCMTALREQRTIHVDDMSRQTDWPEFGRAATTLGVGSSLSFNLSVAKDGFGALNLYGGLPGVFDDDSFLYGEILAQHASVAMAGAQASDQFHRALASRDTIGQAKGIIMERFGITDVQAFAMLTRLSQDSNTKLIDIAARVNDTRPHNPHDDNAEPTTPPPPP